MSRKAFNPVDFPGSGQIITRCSAPENITTNIGFATTVTKKVCWRGKDKKMYLVDITDGLISKGFKNKHALCDYLNRDEYGYRFATPRDVSLLFACVGNRVGI